MPGIKRAGNPSYGLGIVAGWRENGDDLPWHVCMCRWAYYVHYPHPKQTGLLALWVIIDVENRVACRREEETGLKRRKRRDHLQSPPQQPCDRDLVVCRLQRPIRVSIREGACPKPVGDI